MSTRQSHPVYIQLRAKGILSRAEIKALLTNYKNDSGKDQWIRREVSRGNLRRVYIGNEDHYRIAVHASKLAPNRRNAPFHLGSSENITYMIRVAILWGVKQPQSAARERYMRALNWIWIHWGKNTLEYLRVMEEICTVQDPNWQSLAEGLAKNKVMDHTKLDVTPEVLEKAEECMKLTFKLDPTLFRIKEWGDYDRAREPRVWVETDNKWYDVETGTYHNSPTD